MSPTQAREVIEAAAERIADWKSRLKINTGRGVETWDNVTGQMVSVSVPQQMMVKEPLVLQPILWTNTTIVSVQQQYVSSGSPPPPETITIASGWYGNAFLAANLVAGQSVPPRTSDQYKYPDALQPVVGFPEGYFSPTYRPILDLAPDTTSSNRPSEPQQAVSRGAVAGEPYDLQITTEVRIELSIRGYTREYLDDRGWPIDPGRGLPIEFEKGVSVGNYDVTIRKEDVTSGPVIGGAYSATSVLSSATHRIGFPPSTLIFNSVPNQDFGSPGIIGVMSYRKV